MTPNPILEVLSTLSTHQVQYLLMGGQACVFYGGAEFSRDCDMAFLANQENVDRLAEALRALQAVCIAVPPFELTYLERGHAVHFRCAHVEAANMRLDVMSRMRDVAPFAELWQRRLTLPENRSSTSPCLAVRLTWIRSISSRMLRKSFGGSSSRLPRPFPAWKSVNSCPNWLPWRTSLRSSVPSSG